jgi:serine/threonine-protein kinase
MPGDTSPDRLPPEESERWARVDRILDAALERPRDARAPFVREACAGDDALRVEVERLLAACEQAEGDERFLGESAARFAAPVLRDLGPAEALRAAAPPAALVQALAAEYRVEQVVGRGAMATVYLAHERHFDRPVAIKVLRAELAQDCDIRHFQREISRTAKLNHPHIVQVFDSGDAGGLLFYVMPFMAGGTLRQRLARGRQLPIAEALGIARRMAGALDSAHRHGLVHRDVKPENILFAEGEPSLADFGIARALDRIPDETWSSIGLVRGTPEYMSPEQVRAEGQLDGRSDVYALACVLHEMLGGDPPFTGPDSLAVMRRQVKDEPPLLRTVRPDVPVGIAEAIRRALAKAPADRPATAAAFADALNA